MDEMTFWNLVDGARAAGKGDQDAVCDALAAALEKLPAREIAEFDRVFCGLKDRANRWDVWGAAYLAHGGCSDDGFDAFRNWLIAAGRKVYEGVLAEPDSLAGAPWMLAEDGVREFESFGWVALETHQKLTGKDELVHEGAMSEEPAGEEFDFEDEGEMKRRYPKLARLHLEE